MANAQNRRRHAGAVIFTGHMIDLPDRDSPRFPPRLEPLVAEVIDQNLRRLQSEFGGDMLGLSSAARGGDLLFLEACTALGIETFVSLPFSRAQFVETSVAGVPTGNWVERYHRMLDHLGPERVEIMVGTPSPDAYDRCNLRLLDIAGELASEVVLLGLLDATSLEKNGGTAHFVRRVRANGGRIDPIDVAALHERLDP